MITTTISYRRVHAPIAIHRSWRTRHNTFFGTDLFFGGHAQVLIFGIFDTPGKQHHAHFCHQWYFMPLVPFFKHRQVVFLASGMVQPSTFTVCPHFLVGRYVSAPVRVVVVVVHGSVTMAISSGLKKMIAKTLKIVITVGQQWRFQKYVDGLPILGGSKFCKLLSNHNTTNGQIFVFPPTATCFSRV